MNPFDMVIAVILGYSLIVGIFKGFIKEAASIIGVVGGFYAAYAGHEMLGPVVAGWVETPAYRDIIAFILIFLGFCLIVNLLGFLLRLLIKLVLLGAVDRLFGAVLGVLKGALVASLLYVLLIAFLPIGGKQMVAESQLARPVNAVSKMIGHVVPKEKRRAFMRNMEELKKEWSGEKEPESPN